MFFKKNISHIYISFLAFLLFCYQTYLMGIAGLGGDDLYNSMLIGSIRITDKTWLGVTYEQIKGWLIDNSRITWFNLIIMNFFFSVFQTAEEIRAAHWFLNFILCSLFAYFIYLVSNRNFYIAVLSFILIPIFFQYRDWHDPFLIFPTAYHVLLITFFFSIIFFIKFIQTEKIKYYILSILFYIFCCGTFEPAFFLFPVFILISFFFNQKKIGSFVFFAIAAIHFLLIIYLRFILHGGLASYSGSVLSLDLINNLKTLFIQFAATLPLSFALKKFNFSFVLGDYIFLIIFFIFLLFIIKKSKEYIFLKDKNKIFLILIGLAIIISVSPIALSKKYIEELKIMGFGYGYITVLMQYFGFLIFLIFSLNYVLKNNKKEFIIFSFIVSFIAFLNIGSNRNLIDSKIDIRLMRTNITDSIKSGILRQIPEYSSFIFPENFYELWKRPEFFTNSISKKKIFVAYGYDKNIYDFTLKENYIIGGDAVTPYPLVNAKVEFDNSIQRYKFIKDEKRIPNAYKNLLPMKNQIEIYNNSNNIYTLYNFANFEKNRILIAKISSFKIIDNKVSEIFSNEIHFYEEGKEIVNKKFDYEFNLTFFLKFYDLHNPKNNFNLSLLENFHNKVILNNQPKKINLSKDFYEGSIKCETEKIEITNFNFFRRKASEKYNRIELNIENNSDKDWIINDLSVANPITLGAFLRNSKTNETYGAWRFVHYRHKIKSGSNKKIYFNYLDLYSIKGDILTINRFDKYDQIVFSFIHEGFAWFNSKKNFKPCYVNLNYKNKSPLIFVDPIKDKIIYFKNEVKNQIKKL